LEGCGTCWKIRHWWKRKETNCNLCSKSHFCSKSEDLSSWQLRRFMQTAGWLSVKPIAPWIYVRSFVM
jgi:hypothetical protein